MATTVKVRFRISLPAQKEFKIVDKKLWKESKNDFVSALNDEDGKELIVSDYIEMYGLEAIDDSYSEDDPNRELECIEKIIDETGKSI
jgi:hypothetical protein